MAPSISRHAKQSSMRASAGLRLFSIGVADLSCKGIIGARVSHGRLPLIAFGMAHSGKNLLWSGVDGLSLYILIKVVVVSPIIAGMLFVISSFWNAAMDGIWGWTISRSSMIRRMLPGVSAVAVIIACLSFALLPSLPTGAIWPAATALIAFRTSFALLDVPHNAATTPLAQVHGHLALSRWRAILGAGMSVLIAVAASSTLLGTPQSAARAVIIFPLLALSALILLSPLPWLIQALAMDRPTPRSASAGPPAGMPSRALVTFCLIQMMGFAALASIGKSVLHIDIMPRWVLENALLLLSLMRLAGTWLWSPVATRFGSATALSIAYIFCAAAILSLPIAIGWGPVWCAAILCVLGASFGGIALLAWSTFSELLSHSENGAASFSASYGLFTAVSKIGLGFSALLTASWIDQYAQGLAPSSLSLMTIMVAILCILTALAAWDGWRQIFQVSNSRTPAV
tara:strand:+ start:374 stop:1747 length:1374 start_codon:yes stop_codon:yes gene_type:complete